MGACDACDWVLANAETLRITVGRDTVPHMMRKLAAVGADTQELERLYRLEKDLRGSYSGSGRAGSWGGCLPAGGGLGLSLFGPRPRSR